MTPTALVTGGSGGIGAAVCHALSKDGYHVGVGYASGRSRAEKVADACAGTAVPVSVNITDESSVAAALETITKSGPLAVVVNAVGRTDDALLLQTDSDRWDGVMATNLRGTYLVSRLALRHMIRRRHGRIVNVSSVVAQRGNVGQAAYTASKAGVEGFTRSLALEVGRKGITVNAVAPGYVETSMTKDFPADVRDVLLDRAAIARAVRPEEVAAAVAFLVSDAAAAITGTVLPVDGGLN